jgi:hypothetical protein
MVAHGYRHNCYYNHCFLLSLLWGTGVFDHYRWVPTSESIRIWFYWVARTQNTHRFEFWQSAFEKSIQYKTMLISIPQLDYPFYCIGWVQNLETQTGLALVAGIGVIGCLQRKHSPD